MKFPCRKMLHVMERSIIKSRVTLLEAFLQKAIDLQEIMRFKCQRGEVVPKRAGILADFDAILNGFILPSGNNTCAMIDPADVVSSSAKCTSPQLVSLRTLSISSSTDQPL